MLLGFDSEAEEGELVVDPEVCCLIFGCRGVTRMLKKQDGGNPEARNHGKDGHRREGFGRDEAGR